MMPERVAYLGPAGTFSELAALKYAPHSELIGCPTIAAVNGPSITGGFELALACDMIIASENAFFGDTHARVGIVPGGGLSQRLSRLVGIKRAMEISLGCDFVSAPEAAQMGFINRVVPADKLLEAAVELANKIIGNHKESVLKYRQLIKEGYEGDLRTGLRLEVLENALWVTRVKPIASRTAPYPCVTILPHHGGG